MNAYGIKLTGEENGPLYTDNAAMLRAKSIVSNGLTAPFQPIMNAASKIIDGTMTPQSHGFFPSPGVHEGVWCDHCNTRPLQGIRFKMKYGSGEGFDLCEHCMWQRQPKEAELDRYKMIHPTHPTPRDDRLAPSGPKKRMHSSLAGRSATHASFAPSGPKKRGATKMHSSLAGRAAREEAAVAMAAASKASSGRPAHWPPYPSKHAAVRDFMLAYLRKVDQVELGMMFQTALGILPDDDAMKHHLCEFCRVLVAQRFFGFEGSTAAIPLKMVQNVSHDFGGDAKVVDAAYFLRNNVAGVCKVPIGTHAAQLPVQLQLAGQPSHVVSLSAITAKKRITVLAAGSCT